MTLGVGVGLTNGYPVGSKSTVDIANAGMTLAGEDQFDGPAGTAPDARYWDHDLGGGGWGNGELQTYTDQAANARLDGSGHLLIQARRDAGTYTSARLVTRKLVEFGYGLVEARIRMPQGQGVHPAFWLLGINVWKDGWPQAGEIDVMEMVNSGLLYHNAIHGPMDNAPDTPWKQSADGYAGVNLAGDYHVYQVYREPGVVRIGLDGRVVGSYYRLSAPAGARWVFDARMYVVLNVAVGGEWPGPVGAQTTFPATMSVDWVRYWV